MRFFRDMQMPLVSSNMNVFTLKYKTRSINQKEITIIIIIIIIIATIVSVVSLE